jgi:hypothetical protein
MIRCWLGLHDWEYFSMAWTFIKAFPEKSGVGRTCRCCRKLRYLSDDKLKWNTGSYGTLVKIYDKG